MDKLIRVECRRDQPFTAGCFLLYHRCAGVSEVGFLLFGHWNELHSHISVGTFYQLEIRYRRFLFLGRSDHRKPMECPVLRLLFYDGEMAFPLFSLQKESIPSGIRKTFLRVCLENKGKAIS